MSLHPTVSGEVPASTATVARAAFPRGNPFLRLRDQLGTIFTDAQFAPLFAHCGQPAECPWRLALVTLLQFAENLSDRRTAEAVRSRIDWKYLLGLELTDPGFDASVLSEFRSRLVGRRRGRTPARHPLGAVPGAEAAKCPWPTAHRLNACTRGGPLPEPSRMRDRDAAGCPECLSVRGPRVAAHAC